MPEAWTTDKDGSWAPGAVSECDLVHGHDGEHLIFEGYEEEDAYWAGRRVYWLNGRDVTGQRETPTPIDNCRDCDQYGRLDDLSPCPKHPSNRKGSESA